MVDYDINKILIEVFSNARTLTGGHYKNTSLKIHELSMQRALKYFR